MKLYPHFTVQKSGDLWTVYAFVALERPLDSRPLSNGQSLIGGQPAVWLWQCLTGHCWASPATTANLNLARSARAYLQSIATTPGGYFLAWRVARDWGEEIWPGMVRPKEEREVLR